MAFPSNRYPVRVIGLLAIVALWLTACEALPGRRPQATPTPTRSHARSQATSPAPVQPVPATATPDPTRLVYFPQVKSGDELTPTLAVAVAPTPQPTATPTLSLTLDMTATLPTATPMPRPMQLADWPALTLADWPRPANDNGLCMHNIGEAYYDEANLDRQIGRLKEMNIRWTLMLYGDENQLMKAAPRFRDAGITVVWRRMLRANERYYDWGRDIGLMRQIGVEPYMQIYNEPSLQAEWTDGPVDQARFLDNWISAVEQVYNAGGYVGLQQVDTEWLRAALQEIQRRGGEKVFGRMFLVPHPYGLNHPPDYSEDPDGVLSFLDQARVVSETIGFVPPMIAGEAGWKWNATDDQRYPPIDANLHSDYHRAVFDWFRSGVLSNGQPLPDYLFAFCPWLLSSKLDDSAWFDSFAGDHVLTIEAVKAIPPFQRRFSWER